MTENINISKNEIKKEPKKPGTSKFSSENIAEFFKKYIRVLKLARRPTKEEFWKISGIAAIGIALIGLIGFVIYIIFTLLLIPLIKI